MRLFKIKLFDNNIGYIGAKYIGLALYKLNILELNILD